MVETANVNGAPPAIGPYSHTALCNGRVLFVSGQIALDTNGIFLGGDVVAQTKQVFANIKTILAGRGLSLLSVVKTTVFLTSMDDFGKMNEAYEQEFGSHKPARSTIEVSALPKNALVEIEVIACLD